RYTSLPGTNRSAKVVVAELAHELRDAQVEAAKRLGWKVVANRLSRGLSDPEMLDAVEELVADLRAATPASALA
ncbi:MAG: hypothetical protein M3N59_01805, partial [bacterium]|nr:hypothetical protein [bacterium]